MDDVHTFCRSRGADGFAFVVHNGAPDALGREGSGMGYDGLPNALTVEMDTFYNYDLSDLYENHISVMTQVPLPLPLPSCPTSLADGHYSSRSPRPPVSSARGGGTT
jgi:hypothetical protein